MTRRLPLTRSFALGLISVLAIGAAACSSDAKPTAGPAAAATTSSASSAGAPTTSATAGAPSGGAGGCHVDVTGGTTVSYDAPDGPYAADYGPWTPGGLDNKFFSLSCTADGAANSVNLAANNIAIELGAQSFNLHAAAAAPSTDPLIPTIFVNGSAWGLSGDGTVTITEFDAKHIAGSFSFPISDLIKGGTATATGTFNLTNKHGV